MLALATEYLFQCLLVNINLTLIETWSKLNQRHGRDRIALSNTTNHFQPNSVLGGGGGGWWDYHEKRFTFHSPSFHFRWGKSNQGWMSPPLNPPLIQTYFELKKLQYSLHKTHDPELQITQLCSKFRLASFQGINHAGVKQHGKTSWVVGSTRAVRACCEGLLECTYPTVVR